MKTHIFTLIFLLTLSSCSKVADQSDVGEDIVEDTGLVDQTDVSKNLPTAEECETYTDIESCYAAGCSFFVSSQVTIEHPDKTCEPFVQRNFCWMTEDGNKIEGGTVSSYYREEANGDITIANGVSDYVGLLGWTHCDWDCPCMIDF